LEVAVQKNTLERAICKLVIAGEQAGFNVEQMIEFLNAGLSVEGLLDLITLRLETLPKLSAAPAGSSGWLV
jgi:hypothetical protein